MLRKFKYGLSHENGNCKNSFLAIYSYDDGKLEKFLFSGSCYQTLINEQTARAKQEFSYSPSFVHFLHFWWLFLK
jgi:hypothetical protein